MLFDYFYPVYHKKNPVGELLNEFQRHKNITGQ